jgi:TolB protein
MIMGLDGANPVNLTENPASDMEPSWCGSGILTFASDRSGDLEIYVMTVDGGGQTQLTDRPGADFAPACSSAGDKVAYTSAGDGNDEI